jgi:hypothetical protein
MHSYKKHDPEGENVSQEARPISRASICAQRFRRYFRAARMLAIADRPPPTPRLVSP